ncbi:MAG: cytochrome c-type biosis protein CcmH [Chloroflexota bacterium]|nr:cytochrome c-type biosis protein CcmH [Chloroflexota bacterium]
MTIRVPLHRSDLALVVAIAIVVLALLIAIARPLIPTLDARARALDSELRCPVCQGTAIADSPAVFAAEMRAVVRERLAAGLTDEQVRDFFVERYGTWILLAPPPQGPQVLLWLAPGFALAGGALLLVHRARRKQRPEAVVASPAKVSRRGTFAIVVALTLAVGLPVAVVLGPRGIGDEITGTVALGNQLAPSLADREASVASDPRSVVALVSLGDAYVDAGRSAEAVSVYLRALELEPLNVRASLALGVILLSAGRPAEALALFDRLLVSSPDQPDALLYRALARYQLGAPSEEVRSDVLRFLAVAGNDPRRAMAERLLDLASPAPSG